MPEPLLSTFLAGAAGRWRIDSMRAIRGGGLPSAQRLDVIAGREAIATRPSRWCLRGTTSNTRYTCTSEAAALAARQPALDRAQATCAALIPIRKTAAWWAMAQDERRRIFEERSQHIAIGLDHLPQIARRLHHARDLGEPFDFLTWFEFAQSDTASFERMLGRLRATEEWRYVEREVDIRLTRGG